jgi:hypothetical protein
VDDKTAGSHISYLKGQQPTGSNFYFHVCSKVQKNMKILSIREDLITIYIFFLQRYSFVVIKKRSKVHLFKLVKM